MPKRNKNNRNADSVFFGCHVYSAAVSGYGTPFFPVCGGEDKEAELFHAPQNSLGDDSRCTVQEHNLVSSLRCLPNRSEQETEQETPLALYVTALDSPYCNTCKGTAHSVTTAYFRVPVLSTCFKYAIPASRDLRTTPCGIHGIDVKCSKQRRLHRRDSG